MTTTHTRTVAEQADITPFLSRKEEQIGESYLVSQELHTFRIDRWAHPAATPGEFFSLARIELHQPHEVTAQHFPEDRGLRAFVVVSAVDRVPTPDSTQGDESNLDLFLSVDQARDLRDKLVRMNLDG